LVEGFDCIQIPECNLQHVRTNKNPLKGDGRSERVVESTDLSIYTIIQFNKALSKTADEGEYLRNMRLANP
jgi:hypothetical protein